ncbi:PREDICTED: WD repeat-containing protein 63 [Drosophila arizonae]|uniref:WD repeat-containing protein 63 n=1 Tax=Drosophila arizonae TaxID=7263 RepID=A0ABM1PB74_DROAR|nr:PREDICTED: WD repeat-containing protein 63 [Drosophila arizonae]
MDDFEGEGDTFIDASGIPRKRPYAKRFDKPDSDEEIGDVTKIYNVQEAWRSLLSLPTCQKVMVTEHVQKALKIQVGLNVTQEFPWKQVKFKDLRDTLFEELENSAELHKLFKGFNPEHFILIGYCPTLTESDEEPPEGDPFIFYVNSKDTKSAMSIIQNMEAFERWRMQRRLRKKPRRWVSHGTEDEMSIVVERFSEQPVDVEIQSVYPIKQPRHVAFSYRMTRDVRDGVVELLPKEEIKYETVTKRRLPVAVQVAPATKSVEQQTNPTFPSNAWSQYLYEIDDNDLELDESDVEEEEAGKPGTTEPKPKQVPEMSSNMQLLLETLDFNQIDCYRYDYQLITNRQVVHYTNPFLEEFICFANISKSDKRFVASCDWYPKLSGLVAVSYAFSTPVTIELATHQVNFVQRQVLEPNPVLLWSFSDNLNYKLEFEAPYEITKLSFCPFNGDILLGGCQNGQVVLWDLQGRCEHLEDEEYLTPAQAKYRTMIGEYLNWTLDINEDVVVAPATISPLEHSPTGAITGIYWLSRHFYLNNFGKVCNDLDKRANHNFFVTCAFDGTVSFWNLDGESSKKEKEAQQRSKNLPKELTQNESPLRTKTIKPTYSISYSEPVTGLIGDTSVFSILTPSPKVINKSPNNYPISVLAKNPPELRQSLILSTYYGHIVRVDWQGMYSEAGAKEQVNASANFAMVHDGPVVAMSKNPFYPELFASIGRTVFALWKEDYHDSPIIWRKRPCDLTAVAWSETRPAVLYITRLDGILEAWDILARDDDAVLSEVLGGGIITAVTEHRPLLPNKILGIGDYNSSIRMVKLPHSFDVPLDNELAKLMKYVLRQITRKTSIVAWEQKYYELNKDIIEAKREAEEEQRKEMEKQEREMLNPRKRGSDADEEPTKVKGGATYSEKMAKKFDELNLHRMMTILMSRKQMDPEKLARETALEKERQMYETAKKESYAKLLQTVEDDVATIRSRILPAEVQDMQRSEMIAERVKNEMAAAESYETICEQAHKKLKKFPELKSIDYIELLERGMHRRKLLDQSLGGNTERLLWYQEKLRDNQIFECDFGTDLLYNRRKLGPKPKAESVIEVEPQSEEVDKGEEEQEEQD